MCHGHEEKKTRDNRKQEKTNREKKKKTRTFNDQCVARAKKNERQVYA